MASDTLPKEALLNCETSGTEVSAAWDELRKLLKPLASLKLTVALFAMAILIIFFGTLAQVEKDIWEVIGLYFRTAFAWIPMRILFPPSFFPGLNVPETISLFGWKMPFGFYFPGGWLIGGLMVVNLLAAHGLRFTVQSRGTRLWAGLGVIGVGLMTTYLVVLSGSNTDGVQGQPLLAWSTLWRMFEAGLLALLLANGYALFNLEPHQKVERGILAVTGLALGSVIVWLIMQGEAAQLGDSSMRILWQLIKASFASLVILAGCILAFQKRAGIVQLHFGILLMMASEFWVGTTAVEAQMHIDEGETVSFLRDIREVELAVVDTADPEQDRVTVVPEAVLLKPRREGETIQHDDLPFDIRLVKYLKNSAWRKVAADDKNPATAGAGLQWVADELRPGSGTDSGGSVDLPSAYVELVDKQTSQPLGTYLAGVFLSMQDIPEKVTAGGTTYDVFLRFKQTHKPYAITLHDVVKDDYLGTDTPRDYRSKIRLVDASRNVDRDVDIWMNNPLRFAGETFYQSGYNKRMMTQTDPATGQERPVLVTDPETGRRTPRFVESTTLQVVTNHGWMLPYVACMIVAFGMLYQFMVTLLRFLKRRESGTVSVAGGGKAHPERSAGKADTRADLADDAAERGVQPAGTAALWVPIVMVLILGGYVAGKARVPKSAADEMHIHEFGKLPVVYEGRAKPIDTLARNALMIISSRQTYRDADGKEQPAIRWLLDVITGSDAADNHKVFKIENLELLSTLGLAPRSGFRYAVDEFRPKAEEFNAQVELARKASKETPEQMTTYQRKVLELDRKVHTFTLMQAAFRPPPLPPLPTEEEFRTNREQAAEKMMAFREALETIPPQLMKMLPPLFVPVKEADESGRKGGATEGPADYDWQPYATAWMKAYVLTQLLGEDADPAMHAINSMFVSYKKGDAKEFNKQLADYQKLLAAETPANVDRTKLGFELFFNHFSPFYYAAVVYLAAFVIGAASWLGWTRPLNRSSFWLIVLALAVHTFALAARIYISGRPPVTNLYSSAVFIGWGCVVLGIVLELIYRIGIGNIVGAATGFITLGIAHMLERLSNADTFTVMQAVLDTQFWLATHVVCITLGYATTFFAGSLAMVYIILGVCTSALEQGVGKSISRMIYGTLCFAIFFSFVGTVLGGLWADDSWGRFWGWDPKENGALIIVLWNALVLHARWDGMVKERGMAVLAIGGNIVTSWSWFGVNELGVGLHSYGFTEGVLLALGLFILSQLVVIALGCMPRDYWASFRRQEAIGRRQ